MILKIFTIASFIAISAIAHCQTSTDINFTDPGGMKQGRWIKKYPNESIMFDGFFKDNHPVGEFRRYYEDKKLKSVLIYSADGKEAIATIYHPNGYIGSKGKYVDQKKEGKWQFFSAISSGYLICEELYSTNLKNGPSLKFYPDSTVAEKVNYFNNIKQGEWIQYNPGGSMCLRSYYVNGIIDGKFEVWFENGNIEFAGQYKNDARDGLWYVYNEDGSLKYKLEYVAGKTKDRQLDLDESAFLDFLEKNKGKIDDPEKTGTIK